MEVNKIYHGNCLDVLKSMEDESVQCCVTSPPYYGLRDYGHGDQLGLEKTPEEYVSKMVEIFREVKRVLIKDGTLWLNLGDSYAGSGRGANENGKQGTNKGTYFNPETAGNTYGLKPKDLIGIPWMVAFALRTDGWYLRQDIIWQKPNPMPESVTDRCTKAHEYIFLLSKSAKYYYDHESIKTEITESSKERLSQNIEMQVGSDRVPGKTNGNMKAVGKKRSTFGNRNGELDRLDSGNEYYPLEFANKRSVWTVNTMPYSEAHFATFPERLIVDMIKAGCPEGGVVLDPFIGAGTTALVARKLDRNYIGIELNEDYIKIANKRLKEELGLFI